MTSNQLDRETSPYLLQHKDNPVHWWSWSPEAFARARAEDKPILLSIGYAACHWCHVMAHESFEDPGTAALMNDNYINIKVDREERPDIDKVYMAALHSLGEQGGWPLTMFLDPQARPFWGGTYFPPVASHGRPSFQYVLTEIARIWKTERTKINGNSQAIVAALNRETPPAPSSEITSEHVAHAAATIANAVDPVSGGLKGAPKFPQAPIFDFLWSTCLHPRKPTQAAAVETTLTQMAQGGIYDHVGGGLARYSVDADWLVPHFEKMLYDNAQFISLLTRAWLRTRNPLFQIRIEETIAFVLAEMTTPEGLFASSYDADSEGHEGRFYVWTKSEIQSLLEPSAAELLCDTYDVTDEGNWEGTNILNRSSHLELEAPGTETVLAEALLKLRAARNRRVKPGFDHKVLADWNGLMISALADAAFVFNRPDWATPALTAMDRVMEIHWRGERLLHASTGTQARHEATSEDYANLITAARALHGLTGDATHLRTAAKLATALIVNHWDTSRNALFFASARTQELPVAITSIHDDATPNANAVMIANFAALHQFTGDADYLERARLIAECFSTEVGRNPFAAPTYLKNIRYLSDAIQIVAAGEFPRELLLEAVSHTGLDIILHRIGKTSDLPADHPARAKFTGDGKPALFICRGQTCAAPARTSVEIEEALSTLGLLAGSSGVH